METDDAVKALIDKVQSGSLNAHVGSLEGSDFALFIPTFVDNNKVKLLGSGLSQTENNLKISVTKSDLLPTDAKAVAWVGDVNAKDSSCKHGGTRTCKHCTGHTKACFHCSKHVDKKWSFDDIDAPELNYQKAIETLQDKQTLLKTLAKENLGLALLHGHSQKYDFTKLPDDKVSVISDGLTTFRPADEVAADDTFVPNMWRVSGGKLTVAGGYSQR